MATNQTTNYQLNQWEPTDQVLHTDFNADNAKIDAALEGLASAVALCGNCKIESGTYAGNSQYGPSHPCSLTFSGPPLLVLVIDLMFGSFLIMASSAERGSYISLSTEGNAMNSLDWSKENSVSWYYGGTTSLTQANGGGRNYLYIALLAVDK